jgi:molybdopterin/thiamine biosynthesis adenylyltransferase/rhodanese-related sulfurtransferase
MRSGGRAEESPGGARVTRDPIEIDATEARRRVAAGAVLVDVREPGECALAPIDGAIGLPLSRIDEAPARLPDRDRPLVLLCAVGQRSRRAAEHLAALGYAHVASVAGGRAAWDAAGGGDAVMLDARDRLRYARHLVLPEVGVDGQRRLRAATVLLVGAGGLGSPAALYLAAAGVGRLRLVDPDRVEASNLQRQILYREADLGVPKAEAAARTLAALDARVAVEALGEALRSANADRHLAGVDVAIDGTDDLAARDALNAACVRAGVPMVSAAIERFRGQASVYWPAAPGRTDAPCFACVFPRPEGAVDPPDCAGAGVLGVLPGLLGAIQATEALKLILGRGEPLVGRLLEVDALAMRFRERRVRRDPACPVCGARA